MKILDRETIRKTALRIYSWDNLPSATAKAQYLIENSEQDSFTATFSKNNRRTLEGLLLNPLWCSSFCRIPVNISNLRAAGLDIKTEPYSETKNGETRKFAIYHLRSKVTRVTGGLV